MRRVIPFASVIVLALLVLPRAEQIAPSPAAGTMHRPLDQILDLNVRDGLVYYRALQASAARLDRYIASLNVAGCHIRSAGRASTRWRSGSTPTTRSCCRPSSTDYPIHGKSDLYPPNSIRQIPGAFEQLKHRAAGAGDARRDREDRPARVQGAAPLSRARAAARSAAARLRSEAYTAERLSSSSTTCSRNSSSETTMSRSIATRRHVAVTAILSWHAERIHRSVRSGATGPLAERSPIERAIVAFISRACCRSKRNSAEERVQGDLSAVRLAAERSDRRGRPHHGSDSPTKLASSPVRAAGSGWRARARSWRKAAASACARAARSRLAEAAIEVEAAARRPNMVLPCRRTCRPRRRRARHRADGRDASAASTSSSTTSAAPPAPDLLDTSDAEWQAAFDETLFPAIRASRLAVPHMRQRGGGVIIMIASIWGRESGGRMTYNAVKAAEISLAKSLAQQLAPLNIRVNSVAPGSILFPGGSWHKRQQADPQGIAEFVKRELPFGRFGRAEEVGAVVAFLASPRASWVSGASIVVDGCQIRSNI